MLAQNQAAALTCRFCRPGAGHACILDLWSPRRGQRMRVFIADRNGPLLVRATTSWDPRIQEPVCVGCGCTEAHGCPEVCSWAASRLLSVDLAPQGRPEELALFSIGLCSTCIAAAPRVEA